MSSITIQSNLASLRSSRRLGEATSSLQRSFERLSSGLRIVRASDDAAGLAIASELGLNSRVFTQAIRNANDAISLLNIAEGATSQLSTVVIRLKELAESAANGTLTLAQRRSLDSEADGLVKEFNRIVQSTSYNGLNLLNATLGSLGIQLGYTSRFGVNISTGTELDRAVGTGAFATTASYSGAAGSGANVSTADFNGDGLVDYFISETGGAQGQVFLGNSAGGFTAGNTINTGGSGAGGKVGDFNNDGKADILTLSGAGSLRLFLGNGSGGFSMASSTTVSADSSFEVGDVNNDGKLDFVGRISTGGIEVRYGTGTGFSASQILTGTAATGMSLGDINGDGQLDILLAETISNRVRAFTNSGTGTFSTTGSIVLSAVGVTNITAVDLNHDGYDDLVYNSGAATMRAMNNGNGTFGSGTIVDILSDRNSVADVNGDGIPDIVTGSSLFDITTFLGVGDGTFAAANVTSISGSFDEGFVVSDFTGDGAADLMYIDGGGMSQVQLFRADSTAVSTIARLDLLDARSARGALDATSQILDRITKELGAIGAVQSRLDSATKLLRQQVEGSESARSLIQDVDVADETANLVRKQIIQRAAASILAQSNIQPGIALRLLGS